MSKFTEIHYIVYPFSLLLIHSDDEKYIRKILKDRDLDTDSILGNDSLIKARSVMMEGGMSVIIFKEKKVSQGLIAHEALHAVDNLMSRIGNETVNESWNYLLEYIVNEINKFLKNG